MLQKPYKKQQKNRKTGGEEKQGKARKSYEKLGKVKKSQGTSYAIRLTTRQTTHLMPYALPPSPALRPTEKQGKAMKNTEK